jgi:hypothetical protein
MATARTGPADDVRWVGSVSDLQLQARICSGCDVQFLGFPPGTSVAFDLRVYESGLTLMRGVPILPAVHVVAIMSNGTNGPPDALCVGAFVAAKKDQTIVVEYRHQASSLDIRVNNGHASHAALVGDRGVAIYSPMHEATWKEFSDLVSPAVLSLAGIQRGDPICADDDVDDVDSAAERRSNLVASDAQGVDALEMPLMLRFKPLPRMRRVEGMTAAEVTAFNMDRSAYVMYVVSTRYEGRIDNLLGDVQLSFLSFVLLRSLSGLHHWGRLVTEICSSVDLAADARELVARFARILQFQIPMLDQDALPLLGGDRIREAVDCLHAHAHQRVPEVRELGDVLAQGLGWRFSV